MLPSEDPLVERFRSARKTLGIPQATLAKVLGVGQKQVSDYENGVSVPKEETVVHIELLLTEKRLALESLGLGGRITPRVDSAEDTPLLLSDEEYYRHLERFVSGWNHWPERSTTARCEFFIFGPERLPVFNERRDQNLWSTNLRRRVDYHLFGLLDGLEGDQLRDAFLTLRRIEVNAAANSSGTKLSHIHVHGIILDPTKTLEIQASYNRLVETSTSECIVVEKLVRLPDMPDWLDAVRLGGQMPLMIGRAPVDFCITEDPAVLTPPIFAARRAANVSLIPDGTKSTGWLFLDKYDTVPLIKYIDKLLDRPKTVTPN